MGAAVASANGLSNLAVTFGKNCSPFLIKYLCWSWLHCDGAAESGVEAHTVHPLFRTLTPNNQMKTWI